MQLALGYLGLGQPLSPEGQAKIRAAIEKARASQAPTGFLSKPLFTVGGIEVTPTLLAIPVVLIGGAVLLRRRRAAA